MSPFTHRHMSCVSGTLSALSTPLSGDQNVVMMISVKDPTPVSLWLKAKLKSLDLGRVG